MNDSGCTSSVWESKDDIEKDVDDFDIYTSDNEQEMSQALKEHYEKEKKIRELFEEMDREAEKQEEERKRNPRRQELPKIVLRTPVTLTIPKNK